MIKISTTLTLAQVRERYDELPDEVRYIVATAPAMIAIRDNADGLDIGQAQAVTDPFTGLVEWRISGAANAPGWVESALAFLVPV